MTDVCSLSKWKRCLLFFSLLVCFVFCFSLSSFAVTSIGDASVPYSAGLPFDLCFANYSSASASIDSYTYISDANVYSVVKDVSQSHSHVVSTGSSVDFDFYRSSGLSVEDVSLNLVSTTGLDPRLDYFLIDTSFALEASSEAYDQFISTIQFKFDSPKTTVSQFAVSYYYDLLIPTENGDYIKREFLFSHDYEINYSANGDSFIARSFVPTIVRDDINSLISELGLENSAIVSSVRGYVDDTLLPYYYSEQLFIIDNFNGALTLSTINRSAVNSITNLYTPVVSLDNLSWSDWLVNSVGGFMNFQIAPNLSLSDLLALLVGMSLFMVFLRVFAGG